jgi:UDP-N-acetylmuramoyl-tripeptide--D-alanyl-D-alanine ligase
MMLPLAGIADAVGAGSIPDMTVSGYSVDSRTAAPGDLFFALRGPNHDGHDYVDAAFERGAAAAVVERGGFSRGPLLVVEDTLAALQKAAAWARRRWDGVVIGITGSAGKTTTKDAVAHLLGSQMKIGKTEGNLNNHVGLPVSILRLADDARAAALEIGMNHPGEIRHLAALARPSIGVVTNVGRAHLEFFDSVDQVALAKRELIESLPPEGAAVLNADDPRVAAFAGIFPGRVVTFGFTAGATVRAERVEMLPSGTRFRCQGAAFATSLLGRHGVMNLLAALGVACLFGIAAAGLRDAVASFAVEGRRGRRFEHGGITVWDDCYNANPEAVRAMLEALRDAPARRRIAVLGEMLELGRWAEDLHREAGRCAASCDLSVLVGIRGAARHIVDTAKRCGFPDGAAYFFEDPGDAGEFLRGMARPGDVILFKGSRGTRVERALERFLDPA